MSASSSLGLVFALNGPATNDCDNSEQLTVLVSFTLLVVVLMSGLLVMVCINCWHEVNVNTIDSANEDTNAFMQRKIVRFTVFFNGACAFVNRKVFINAVH